MVMTLELRRPLAVLAVAVLALLGACTPTSESPDITGVTQNAHRWFPISPGTVHAMDRGLMMAGTMACESCHPPSRQDFRQFSCIGCHEHEQGITDRLHLGLNAYYSYSEQSCYQCHATGEQVLKFDHAGITGECAACHDVGTVYAALPKAGFTHSPISSDCGGCHNTDSWENASSAPSNSFDPAMSVTVTGQIPSYAGTSIVKLTPLAQTLPMTMNHVTTHLSAATLGNCVACHPDANAGGYFPGKLHTSLGTLMAPALTGCSSCHASAVPTGFVGPNATSPVRSPTSPEMKHDAVAWTAGAPTATELVKQDCIVCHQAPTEAAPSTWSTSTTGAATATYHPALTAAGQAQPTSCVDCHANSRPTTPVSGGSLPVGLEYDHQTPDALGDCGTCHSSGGTTQWTSWEKGRFHLVGSSSPQSCVACHEGERPTSTTGWQSTTYTRSPFDYVGRNGHTHGNAEDCAVCHTGPGTGGTWGGTQSWVGGTYDHEAPTASARNTCLPCHATQVPAVVVDGFNHATSGTGDCLGCHQATVAAKRYVDLSDWAGGQSYPAASLITAPGQFVSVTSIALTRAGTGLVTGMTSSSVTLNNAMLHTATALPTSLNAGSSPDYGTDQGKCWHCHTQTPPGSGNVTDPTNGFLHAAFTNFRTTPTGTVTGLAQPTKCLECHAVMRPPKIVELTSATSLVPMDHSAAFAAPVTIGGVSVTSVTQIECSICHSVPGTNWADGKFHSKIAGGQPADCVACHYPLMADAAKSDLTTPEYSMKHRSSRLTSQACQTCHPSALSKSSTVPATAALWKPGTLHPTVAAQPTACNDCHSASVPAGRSQSAHTYAHAKGGTATNGAQWMSHGASSVAGKDCVVCHAADAKTSGSAWSKSTSFHGGTPTGVTTCNVCHGGTPPGTNNNLPSGLTDSTTVTTSSAAAAGTRDQITHSDLNVTKFECNFCHTQVGRSTTPGVQGKEWAQARFHRSFTSSNPLVTNGTTARCSNCHMNVKPGASYTDFDHAPYTSTSTQDCSACHAWPGTNPTTPNWLGTAASHAATGSTAGSTLDCGTCHGQTGSASVRLTVPTASHYLGVSNGNTCISCHVNFAGFMGTVTNLKYSHSNTAAYTGNGCGNCHAFKSQVYTTLTTTPPLEYPVSPGGHTFSQGATVSTSYTVDGKSRTVTLRHTDAATAGCGGCHPYAATSSSTDIWVFVHEPDNGIRSSRSSPGCIYCHD